MVNYVSAYPSRNYGNNLYGGPNGSPQGWYSGPSNYVTKMDGAPRLMNGHSGGGGGCGGVAGGGCAVTTSGGGGGYGGADYGRDKMATRSSASKQYISRAAFNGIQNNLKRTRILGVILTIFSALTVALGLSSILLYHFGTTMPMEWCKTPHPASTFNRSLKPVAPVFNYITAVSGFLGIAPLITGIMTAYLTRIYGTYANTAMYLSFLSVAVLPVMFVLSLICFLLTFGDGGSEPTCKAFSAVSMLLVIHAVVCSLLLYIIYFTMSRFLKNLKKDPSVDYEILKKYYGKKKITVVDDGYDDDDSDMMGSGMCCGCCDNKMDGYSDSSDDEDDDRDRRPQMGPGVPGAAYMPPRLPTNYRPPPTNYRPPQFIRPQAYAIANPGPVYGPAQMAGNYNPYGYLRKF